MKSKLFILFCFLSIQIVLSQIVYKTPSGNKFHTATCRHVKNVSEKLSVNNAINRGLSACLVCKPLTKNSIKSSSLGIRSNEAKGNTIASQCKGKTQAGLRCKRKTRNVNGFCFQHER